MKYILLDTETSGLDTELINGVKVETNNRVVQLGYIVLDKQNVEIIEELASLPEDVEINFFAMATHNITPELIKDKPLLSETKGFKYLNEDLNIPQNIIVIHNAKFDLNMLERDGFKNKMTLIDTLQVAKHLYPDSEAHSLQYLRYSLGLYKTELEESKKLNIELVAHDAMGDILFMKMLLSKMNKDVKSIYNLSSNSEAINKMIELTNKKAIIKKFKFGKHKGELIEEVVKKDLNYVNWLLNNPMDDEDLMFTIKSLVNKKKDKNLRHSL